ncbi:MAG TPA: ABC transporter permease [Gammaproteobacteria bacterium]|nr:ABC transporter permease [Gammaproteobacteria bacterium]
MAAIRQDLWHALRLLARSPRFAAIAIVTLALGIGANTAVFSVFNAVLLKPLPFRDAERLMLVHLLDPTRDAAPGVYNEMVWSYPKYRSFAGGQQAFEDLALFARRELNLTGDGDPQHVQGEAVTDTYPAVLGVSPILGRTFTYDESNRLGTAPVVMLGYGLWMHRYGGDPGIVGRTIQLDATPHTVAGVMPAGFAGLSGSADLWLPLAQADGSEIEESGSHSYSLVGRRKADVSEDAAIAATRVMGDAVGAEFAGEGPDARRQSATAASMYASRADSDVRRATWLLLGAVAFVLLIACVNVANLFLAKAIERRREVAIRVALGASRGRIGRQFLVETLVLATLGAMLGLAVASLLLSAAPLLLPDAEVLFRSSIAPGAPRIRGAEGLTRIGASSIGLDTATLLFTVGVTVVAAALLALLPTLQAASLRPIEALKAAGSAMGSRGRRDFVVRAVPIVAQIALALVLLAGAGLVTRSALELQATGIGVDAADVVTVRMELPDTIYDADRGGAFYASLMERVRALPGVAEASLGSCAPVSGGCNQTYLEFIAPPREGTGLIGMHWATPGYFATLGIALLEGRSFEDSDRTGRPKVLLINEAAARELWPNESAIGKRIAVHQGGFQDGAEVVGVVANTRYRTIESDATADVYVPLAQSYRRNMIMFVRSRLPLESLVPAIAGEARALDPTLPLSAIKTMDARVADAMWRTRVGAWLLGAFAGLALLLTAIGIFGVMAQSVAHRTAEIGVRMALGAQAGDVVRLMLRRATAVTVAGVGLGVVFALALMRLLSAMLYGVRPHDPIAFGAAAVLLAGVALLACYLPARRAARVEAVVALRSE